MAGGNPGTAGPGAGPGAVSLFAHDVGRALRIWRRAPLLPVVALGIAALIFAWYAVQQGADVGIGFVGLFVQIALVGFLGAERVWYVSVDRGLGFTLSDAWHFTKALWRRFFGLGLLMTFAISVPAIVIFVASDQGWVRTALVFVLFAVLDFTLTFATPCLAFNDVSAADAVRHSIAVIKEQWPSCAMYALVPPLAIQFAGQVIPRDSLSVAGIVAIDLAVAAIALVCKGATVLFYADRYPTLAQ